MEFTDEIRGDSYALTIEIGEDRALDSSLLEKIKEIALSPIAYSPGEKEFFLNVLNQPHLNILEDWQLVKFVRIAEKANVKIKLLGKSALTVKSTVESQKKLVEQLKFSYLKEKNTKLRNILEENDEEKELEDISTASVNLVMVNKISNSEASTKMAAALAQEQKVEDNDSLFQEERKTSSYELIYGKKQDYPISDLMKSSKNSEYNQNSKRILIEGWAGMGKTVLCQYLTVMWARGVKDTANRWWSEDIQIVLWIPLRNLTYYDQKNLCLGEIVRRECLGIEDSKNSTYPSAVQIEADLAALGNKVVYLLDGFDEVAEWFEEYELGSQQTPTARSDLLKNDLLGARHRHHAVLLSRPSNTACIGFLFDNYLEMSGLKDEDIEAFIKKYFKLEPSRSEGLLTNMNMNTNLWGMAHVPVNIAMICLWWKENSENKSPDNVQKIPFCMTMTELYSEVILLLLRRDWVKRPVDDTGKAVKYVHANQKDLSIDAKDISIEDFENKFDQYPTKLKFLREIAWCAQTSSRNNLYILGEQILAILKRHHPELKMTSDCYKKLKEVKLIGLLESRQQLNIDSIKKNQFYFSHLTFQEYFAAKYWVALYCSDDETERNRAEILFNKYKYYPQFEIVWWFASGLLSKKPESLIEKYFVLLNERHCDLVGVRHITLLMRCLEENQHMQSTSKLIGQIIPYFKIPRGIQGLFYNEVLTLKYQERVFNILRLCPTIYESKIFDILVNTPFNEHLRKSVDLKKTLSESLVSFEVFSICKKSTIINRKVESFVLKLISLFLEYSNLFEDQNSKDLLLDKDFDWINLNIVSNEFIHKYLEMLYKQFSLFKDNNDLKSCIYVTANINQVPLSRVMLYDENAYEECVAFILYNEIDDERLNILNAFKGMKLLGFSIEFLTRLSELMLIQLNDSDSRVLFELVNIVVRTEIFFVNMDIQKKCIEVFRKLSNDSDENVQKKAWALINDSMQIFDKQVQKELCLCLVENLVPIDEKNHEEELVKLYVPYIYNNVLNKTDRNYNLQLKCIGIIASLPREFLSYESIHLCVTTLKMWFTTNICTDYNKWLLYGSKLSEGNQSLDIQNYYLTCLNNLMTSHQNNLSDVLKIIQDMPKNILKIEYLEELITKLLKIFELVDSENFKLEVIDSIYYLLSDRISNKIKRDFTGILVNVIEVNKKGNLYNKAILILLSGKLLVTNQKKTNYIITLLDFCLSEREFYIKENTLEELPYHMIPKKNRKDFISKFLQMFYNESSFRPLLSILKGLLKNCDDIDVMYEIGTFFMKIEKHPKIRLDLLKLVPDSLLIDAIKTHVGEIQIPIYNMFCWYCIYMNRVVILEQNTKQIRYQSLNGLDIIINNKVLVLFVNMMFESLRRKFNLPPLLSEQQQIKPFYIKKPKSTNDLLSHVIYDTVSFVIDSDTYYMSIHEIFGEDSLEICINYEDQENKMTGIIENIKSFLNYKCVNIYVDIEHDKKNKITIFCKPDDIKWIKMNIIQWMQKEFEKYLRTYIEATNFQGLCTIL